MLELGGAVDFRVHVFDIVAVEVVVEVSLIFGPMAFDLFELSSAD